MEKKGYLKRMSRRLIAILVLGMLVLASMQVVSATGEVTWWWKGGGIMDQTKPIKTRSDKITLTPSDEASWDAGNAAQVDLTFPAGTWTVVLYAYTWGDTVSTTVTVWNKGTGETICQDTFDINVTAGTRVDVSMTAGPASFSVDDKVAVSVKANSGGNLKLYYNAIGKPARLVSPSGSPAYPGVPVPDIEIKKTASPTEGTPCTDVTFTITVTNTGDCTLNPVTVVDTLPAGMSYVSDDSGGSVVGNTITWTTSLGMGASQIIHLVAHIDAGASGTLTDSVTATGTPPKGADVTDSDTADVTALASGISVEKVANPTSNAPSTKVTFTITVTNTGDCTLDPVTVVDTLPAGMSYVSSSPAGSVVGNTITWDVGPQASRASKMITLVAHIDAGAAGMLENVVCVTGTPSEGADVHDCDTADIEVEALAPTIEPPQQTLIEITTDIKSDGTVIEEEQFGWEAGNGNLLNNPPLAPGEAVGGIKYDEKMIGSNGATEFTKRFEVDTNVTPNLDVTKDIGYKSGDLGSLSHAEQVGMRYSGASPPLSSNTKCVEVEAYSKIAVTNVRAATETEVGITETHERGLLYKINAESNGTVAASVDAYVEDGGGADALGSRMTYKEKSIAYGEFTFTKEVGYKSKPPT
ncbi:DUF11 domain-containing protein [Methanophagales archaeon]|nr:MAG: DUF11 domain-containing protein [Methanophagales archaeon]